MGIISSKNKAFYRIALALTAPIALQNLIASGLNLVDTILIGGLGPTAIAAVGLANQVFFLFNLVSFGICSGMAIFIAQFWGGRDAANIRRVLGLCLISNTAVALLFFALAFFLPGPVMRLFTTDPQVILLGCCFLRIIALSYLMFGVTFAYAFVLRGVGKPIYPMVTGFVAFGLNTFLNYLLIYGHGGLPRLGVSGSALATLIARTVEVVMILGFVYGLRLVPAAKPRELLDLSAAFVKRIYRTTVPVILNEFLWALGITMYTVVYGRLGTQVIAAYNIFSTVERLSMVLFFGLASACAVMVGQRIGAGDEETAFAYAKKFSFLGPALGLLIAGGLLLASGPIWSVFRVPGEVTAVARQFLTVFALTIPIRIFNLTNIVGILRSGGDTRFSLFIDTAGLWLLAVPLAFLGGLVWHLPPIYIYLLTVLEEAFKFSLGLWRMRSGRWINNLVCGMGA